MANIRSVKPMCAPGCYGSALCYKEGSPECEPCQFRTECAPLSTGRLAKLRIKLPEIFAAQDRKDKFAREEAARVARKALPPVLSPRQQRRVSRLLGTAKEPVSRLLGTEIRNV